jgi:penicillin-binding protein 1C
VSARTALASSLNVPAVRTLGSRRRRRVHGAAPRLGFVAATEDGEFYGPALALGGTDVTLEELVGAYRALANGGVWSPLRCADGRVAAGRRVSRRRPPIS